MHRQDSRALLRKWTSVTWFLLKVYDHKESRLWHGLPRHHPLSEKADEGCDTVEISQQGHQLLIQSPDFLLSLSRVYFCWPSDLHVWRVVFFGWPSDSHVSVCFLSTQCEHTLEMRQSGREVSVLCLGCCLDLIGVLLDHKMNSSRNSWFSPFATAWQYFCFVLY